MPHVLILGMTESGKTTLAKRMVPQYRAKSIPTLVLDPLNDPAWQADFQTADPEVFLQVLWASQSCAAFIDEAGQAVGRYDLAMQECATRARHWGHNVHFITQRGVQLAVTVRDQCSQLFLFTTAKKDSEVHANEWNCDELREASTLRQGEFFHVTRFGLMKRGSLFYALSHTRDTVADPGASGGRAGTEKARASPDNKTGGERRRERQGGEEKSGNGSAPEGVGGIEGKGSET